MFKQDLQYIEQDPPDADADRKVEELLAISPCVDLHEERMKVVRDRGSAGVLGVRSSHYSYSHVYLWVRVYDTGASPPL